MRWDQAYGADGSAFPVAVGDVWACGPHKIVCLDLEDAVRSAAWLSFLAEEGGCAMAYTDPPWGAGNARSFRTKAGVDGDKGRAVDFPRLINLILAALDRAVPAGPVWVEMGDAEAGNVRAALEAASWPVSEIWPATYYGNKPCSIIRADRGLNVFSGGSPAGLDDMLLPAFTIARDSVLGDRVYDPCTGRGLTATAAAEVGRAFRGSELNPRRVSVTLAKLSRLTGLLAQKEGALL